MLVKESLMRKLFLIALSLFLFATANAQDKKKGGTLDFGLYLGGSNYWGELTKDFQPVWGNTNIAGGLICRFNINSYLTFKGTALYGQIEGADKNFSSDIY